LNSKKKLAVHAVVELRDLVELLHPLSKLKE
jgi:hypothetical protein